MVGLILSFHGGMFWKRRAAVRDSGTGVLAVVGVRGGPGGQI